MFGLAFSTLLTLLLCPVLYAILFRIPCGEYTWDPALLEKSRED